MRDKPTGPTVHNKMLVMLPDNDLKPALTEAAWIQCSQKNVAGAVHVGLTQFATIPIEE